MTSFSQLDFFLAVKAGTKLTLKGWIKFELEACRDASVL